MRRSVVHFVFWLDSKYILPGLIYSVLPTEWHSFHSLFLLSGIMLLCITKADNLRQSLGKNGDGWSAIMRSVSSDAVLDQGLLAQGMLLPRSLDYFRKSARCRICVQTALWAWNLSHVFPVLKRFHEPWRRTVWRNINNKAPSVGKESRTFI